MLPGAQALFAARRDNNGKDDPEGFCLPPGFPRVNGVPFRRRSSSSPARIVILYETRTTFRQIFFDSNHTLANDPQPTWMGYSKGRWDGDTLIVETTGFNDRTWLDDAGHPHSEQMKVTERFRRPTFGQLLVDITIDDPKVLRKTVDGDAGVSADGRWRADRVRLQREQPRCAASGRQELTNERGLSARGTKYPVRGRARRANSLHRGDR